MEKRIISVYLDDGVVYEYSVEAHTKEAVMAKVREHSSAITEHGYRHNDGDVFECYPAWRVLKVKSKDIGTLYIDVTRGT